MFFFPLTALSHHYGKDGRETSKVDTNGIIIDFELFKHLTTEDFINNALTSVNEFVEFLNKTNSGIYKSVRNTS